MKRLLTIILAFLPVLCAAQEEDNTFGGWIFAQAKHSFSNGMYASAYFHHSNFQFQRLESNYMRLSVGTAVLPWLSAGVNYVPVFEPGGVTKHYAEADLVGTIKSGNIKISLRERYRYGFTTAKNELRTRLKVSYSFPESRFGVYVAPEVFTRGNDWLKTRHFAALTFDITRSLQFETYYMYYAFKSAPAENVLGLGLNLTL